MTFFFDFFLSKPKPYGPKGLSQEIFDNRIRFGRDTRLLNISTYAQHAKKLFCVCSLCNEILTFLLLVSGSLSSILSLCFPCLPSSFLDILQRYIGSAYAQHAMKSFPCMLSMRLDVHIKTVEISSHTAHTRKFVGPMLSVR